MNWPILISDTIIYMIVYNIGNCTFEKRRESKLVTYMILAGVVSIQIILNGLGYHRYAAFTRLLLFVGMLFSIFKISLKGSILISLFSFIFVSLSEFLSIFLFNLLFGLDGMTTIESIVYVTSLIVSDMVFFISSFYLIEIIHAFRPLLDRNISLLALVAPVSTFIVFMTIEDYFGLVIHERFFFFSLFLLAFSNLVTLYLFYKLLDSAKMKEELKVEKEENQKKELQFQLMSQQYKNNFSMMHSLLHSYADLKKLLDENKMDEMADNLERLSEQTFTEFNSIYSESLLLNSLINNRMAVLRKKNICFNTNLLYTDFSFMELSDQIDFFDELIKICIKQENRTIFIKTYEENNKVYLKLYFESDDTDELSFLRNSILNRMVKKYDLQRQVQYDPSQKIMRILFVQSL